MFIEPIVRDHTRGWIEVICGSMFSGKTEELIRRLKRAGLANMKVEIFKPTMDDRYHRDNIVSHDENTITSTAVAHARDILRLVDDVDVVGMDEAQFFDESVLDVCTILAMRGVRVIVAGLDMDYTGKPFGKMPELLAIADHITKLHAICMKCGDIANFSYRKSADQDQVVVGELDIYEARCRTCFNLTN